MVTSKTPKALPHFLGEQAHSQLHLAAMLAGIVAPVRSGVDRANHAAIAQVEIRKAALEALRTGAQNLFGWLLPAVAMRAFVASELYQNYEALTETVRTSPGADPTIQATLLECLDVIGNKSQESHHRLAMVQSVLIAILRQATVNKQELLGKIESIVAEERGESDAKFWQMERQVAAIARKLEAAEETLVRPHTPRWREAAEQAATEAAEAAAAAAAATAAATAAAAAKAAEEAAAAKRQEAEAAAAEAAAQGAVKMKAAEEAAAAAAEVEKAEAALAEAKKAAEAKAAAKVAEEAADAERVAATEAKMKEAEEAAEAAAAKAAEEAAAVVAMAAAEAAEKAKAGEAAEKEKAAAEAKAEVEATTAAAAAVKIVAKAAEAKAAAAKDAEARGQGRRGSPHGGTAEEGSSHS